jgi:tetratricopeptide (TPR) repeat protein
MCGIFFITFLIYIPAIRGGFVWDDAVFLTNNRLIKADDGLYRFWFTSEATDYYPLTWTTLWLEWRLWGMNASAYHIVNVFLHAVISVLIWLTLNRLKIPGAWLAGLIFAVHPVNVESVAWIIELKNILPMVFYVLSIQAYLKFEREQHTLLYGLSLGCFLLALLSKASVVMLPFVLLGCVWWQRNRIGRKDLIRTLPYFALSAILSLATVYVHYQTAIGEDAVRTDGFLSRLAGAGWAVWFYLYKAIVPYNLCFVYPRWEIDASSIVSFLPGVLLAGVLILFWRYRKSWGRPFLFGMAYYVVTLFPVLGFFNIYFMKYSLVADHWQYTSIIGIIALLVGLGSYKYPDWHMTVRRVTLVAAVAGVALLSLQTWRQGHIYRNNETLWRDTIAKNPGCWPAHTNLGLVLARQGRTAEAIDHYVEALRIRPVYEEAHNSLGVALAAQGNLDEAISHYSEALRINPHFFQSYTNLGNALKKQGKIEQALSNYSTALQINPRFAAGHVNLGVALAEQGKTAEAIRHYSEALRINPDAMEARINLGTALITLGKLDEAIELYTQALLINPGYAEVHNYLGVALVRKGKTDEAIVHFKEALRIKPDYADAQNNLKRVLTAHRKFDEALATVQHSLKLNPQDPVLHYRLGNLYKGTGRLNEAIDQYEKALSIQPEFVQALNNLAVVYMIDKKYDRAISLFKKMIGLRPDNAEGYYNIACIYSKENRIEESIDWLKQAIERGYKNWDLLKTDKDLENIRGSMYYKELIKGR